MVKSCVFEQWPKINLVMACQVGVNLGVDDNYGERAPY